MEGDGFLISLESNDGNILSVPPAAAKRWAAMKHASPVESSHLYHSANGNEWATHPLSDNVFECRSSHVVGLVKINS